MRILKTILRELIQIRKELQAIRSNLELSSKSIIERSKGKIRVELRI